VHESPNTLIFGIHNGFYGAPPDAVSRTVYSCLHSFVIFVAERWHMSHMSLDSCGFVEAQMFCEKVKFVIHTCRYARCGYIGDCLFVCLFVCVFLRLRIFPRMIKLAASNFVRQFIDVQGSESPIVMNFAAPEAQNRTNRPAWLTHM